MKYLITFIAVLLAFACGTASPAKSPEKTPEKAPEKKEATASSAETGFSMELETVDGNTFSFDSIRGKKHLVVAFWATWCEPCKAELMQLSHMYSEFSDKIEFVAVSTDGEDLIDKVTEFATESALPFPVLLDPSGNFVASVVPGGNSVPYSVIVRKDGTIHSKHSGYKPGDEITLKKELEELLEKEK